MDAILNDDKQGNAVLVERNACMYVLNHTLHMCTHTHTHTLCNAEHDPLFYMVYERMPVVKGSLEPHLWSYRPHITLEHLIRYMQQQKMKFPILKEFLNEVRL